MLDTSERRKELMLHFQQKILWHLQLKMVYVHFSYSSSLHRPYLQNSWIELETIIRLNYFKPLIVDKGTIGDTGSKFIVVEKSPKFSYEELANATNNFSLASKIGHGGFGEVYYGELRGKVCNLSTISFTSYFSNKHSIVNIFSFL